MKDYDKISGDVRVYTDLDNADPYVYVTQGRDTLMFSRAEARRVANMLTKALDVTKRRKAEATRRRKVTEEKLHRAERMRVFSHPHSFEVDPPREYRTEWPCTFVWDGTERRCTLPLGHEEAHR